MCREKYLWLAAVILAQPDSRISGRIRLQKTVMLLQKRGLPTDYQYRMHFRGPYSESLMEDIQLLVQFDTVAESRNGSEYTFEIIPGTFEMNDEIRSTMDHLAAPIAAIAAERDINVLELAATFDYAKSLGRTDEEAYLPMRRKPCWSQQREESALLLLQQLGPQETDETRC